MSVRPLRVAMVLQSYPPVVGGAQRQVQQLAPLLRARGVEPTIVTRRPEGMPELAVEDGVEIWRVSRGWGSARASVAFTVRGSARVLASRPDIVHVHDLMSPATVGLLSGGARRVPVVAKIASTGPGGDVDRLVHKAAGRVRLRLAARRFAAFACLTGEVEEELLAHGVPRHRLRRLPNGVDVSRFRPACAGERRELRRGLGLPEDAPIVLYCGRFAPVKRLPLLVEAFAAAAPASALLVLVGEGSERQAVTATAAATGLPDRVRLYPRVDDVAPFHRAADVYASSSSTEGMSGSVLEAMACGVPVAATPASGMNDLLEGGCGQRAPDADSLGAGLAALLRDPARGASMGAAARRRVVERFSIDGVADTLARLYRELAARGA
jgi:glycosyltransferase involved in cell wall biosynthesis